jgi:cell division protein FtsZ
MAGDFFMSSFEPRANIKVLGIGGCGGNAVSYMIEQGLQGAEFLAANTDLQALSLCKATKKVQMGERIAGGLGVGCNPEKGKKAAEESIDEVQRELENIDMLFLTGGMGGGTGTGGLPVAAQLAREMGILTVAVVTRPFTMEGSLKSKVADEGVRILEDIADSLILIPNQRILDLDKKLTFKKARSLVDEVLYKAVKGIIDIVQFAGILNVDMEDVRSVMKCRGRALMGMGHATGEEKTQAAILEAISNPLVENDSIDGCTGALINITANGDEFTSEDLEIAVSAVSEHAAEDAIIKAGLVERPDLDDEIYITVIATGFDQRKGEAPRRETMAQHKVRTSTDARSTIVPGAQTPSQKVRRITDANQIHLPIAGESEELAFSEEITSIPAFITHMQKNR